MKRNFKLLAIMLVLVVMVLSVASCDKMHKHEFSAEWSADETNHWHVANCDTKLAKLFKCSAAVADKAAHTFENGACTVCEYAQPGYTPDDKPACTEHQYGAPVVTKAATCTEAGEQTLTCTVCNEPKTVEIAPLGHDEQPIAGTEPTCTEPGKTAGKQCSVCHTITVEQTELNPTGHTFDEGTCHCGAVDPDYNGPKTYVLTSEDLDTFASGDKTDGESYQYSDFFTLYYGAKTKLDTSNKSFPDGYNGTKRINWQATTVISADSIINAVKFTVDGTATVKVWWVCGGINDDNSPRRLAIYDANGTIVAESTVEGSTHSPDSKDETYKNDMFITELTIPKSGEYYLGNPDGSNYYFKVEVTVTPVKANNFPVTTIADSYWNDVTPYTFTAEESGTYTITLPAGLGMWTKASYDKWDDYADVIDFGDNTNGHTFDYYLAKGESITFYVGSETAQDWNITWTCVAGEKPAPTPDGSLDLPYVWETLPETVPVNPEQTDVNYTFTATESGNVTFTWETSMGSAQLYFAELDENGDVVGEEEILTYEFSYTVAIDAGKTYRFGLVTEYVSWYGESYTEGDKIDITFAACAHAWSEASCKAPATCSGCGATKGEALEHTEGPAATCTTAQTCTVCGTELRPAAHTWGVGEKIDPTDCSKQKFTCTVEGCGETKEEIISYGAHNYEYIENAPTCTTAGYYKTYCLDCGYVDYEETPAATGHGNYNLSCGETGACLDCGAEFTKQHDTTYGNSATCTTGATCWLCNKEVGDPLGHTFGTDGICTVENCGAKNEISISDALAVGAEKEHNTYTEIKYFVTGIISSIVNTSKGNLYIRDDNGNTIYIYGLYSADGETGYGSMETKPVVGDTITVLSVIGKYSSAVQLKDAWLVNHVVHVDHVYTTFANKCDVCGVISTHDCKDENTDYICDLCGEATGTESTVIDFSAQGYSNATEVTSVTSDDITVTFDKGTGSNTSKYYTSGTAVRVYGGNTVTVSAASGYKIVSISITFGSSDGSNAITADAGTYADGEWAGSADSVVLTIGGTSGNRRFLSITVNYVNA